MIFIEPFQFSAVKFLFSDSIGKKYPAQSPNFEGSRRTESQRYKTKVIDVMSVLLHERMVCGE